MKFVETESKHVKRVAAHVCDVLCVFCVYCCWIFAPHSVVHWVHWVHWIRVLSVRLQRQQWNPAFSSPSWASRSFCCIPDQGCRPRRITCRFRPGHGWVILSPKSHQGLPNSKRKWRRTFCEQLLLSTDLVSVKVLLKTTWQLVPFWLWFISFYRVWMVFVLPLTQLGTVRWEQNFLLKQNNSPLSEPPDNSCTIVHILLNHRKWVCSIKGTGHCF